MTHWRTCIERDYLAAWDLVDKSGRPRDVTVRITSVASGVLKTKETPKGKRKCVISFERTAKKMVCNSTNGEVIECMYGPDYEGWIGKTITLYQGDVRSPKGGTIKGVKVRPKIPTGAAEAVEPAPVDEQMRGAQNEAFGREGSPQ